MDVAAQENLQEDPALARRWMKVRAKLETAKPHLQKAGAVLPRRQPGQSTVWVARFRVREQGRTKYKSIYLGSRTIADRARQLIAKWRSEAQSAARHRHRTDFGVHWVIAGHNARLSLTWAHDDNGAGAASTDSLQAGLQLQF